jgi:hypothetical protein
MKLTNQEYLQESLRRHRRQWQEGRKEEVSRRASEAGPYALWFIERLWARAALLAYGDSVEVLQCVRWYSAERVEQAIKRAIKSKVEEVEGLRAILEEGLEEMRDRADEELDGQLVFPFMGDDRRKGGVHGMGNSGSCEKHPPHAESAETIR